MRYRAILFDVDGTIVDSQHAVIAGFQRILRELGLPEPDAELRESALRGPGLRVLQNLGVENAQEAAKRWAGYCAAEEKTLFAGMEALLNRLREKGLKLGIVTSRTASETEVDPPVRKVLPLFHARVYSGETPRPKPAPEPIFLCLERLAVAAEEALYIGDSPTDQQSARAAGVDFALALWGSRDGDIPADYALARPEDVLEILREETLAG